MGSTESEVNGLFEKLKERSSSKQEGKAGITVSIGFVEAIGYKVDKIIIVQNITNKGAVGDSVCQSVVGMSMRWFIFLVACIFFYNLMKASDGSEKTTEATSVREREIVISYPDPKVQKLAYEGMLKVMKQCPGINAYLADLSYVRVDDYTMIDNEWQRVDVVFKVSEDPDSMPPGISLSRGHTCAFGISTDMKRLIIMKPECAAVCKQRHPDSFESGKNYVGTLD